MNDTLKKHPCLCNTCLEARDKELNIAREALKEKVLKALSKAQKQIHGGGNGRRLLFQLRDRVEKL